MPAPATHMSARSQSMLTQRGAILMEYLIALMVLAIMLTGIFNLLSVGYLSQALAQDLSLGTHLAQRRLEAAKAAGYEAAVSMPREPVDTATFPGYLWEADVIEQATGLKQVTATVFWTVRGRQRSVSLVTLVRSP